MGNEAMNDGRTAAGGFRAWLNQSLARRFALGTAAGLVVSSVVFLVLFVGMYRQTLEHEKAAAVGQINSLLRSSLENAMLKRDLDGLRFLVSRLGSQEGIAAVFITNPAGEIRFASDPAVVGQHYGREWIDDLDPSTRFLARDDGREVLRSRVPVRNRPDCRECHGPVETSPVNGVLYVDYDASTLRAAARTTTLVLMGSGALIVLLNLAGGWWFIRRFVITPVQRLARATEGLARGDLGTRAGIAGSDEMAQLGASFDRMAERLEDSTRSLRDHERFLQDLLDAVPDGVRILDESYRVLACNRSYRLQVGLPPEGEIAEPCYALSFGRDAPCPPTVMTCPLHEVRSRQESVRTLQRHLTRDGRTLDVEIHAAPLRLRRDGREQLVVVESLRDLATQIRYSHEQKLSEVGKLAAGVAHEIHNPLASIRFALHAARGAAQAGQTDEATQHIDLVDHEIDKCINVSERLLKLSMTSLGESEIVDVNAAVSETLSLVRWEAEQLGVDIGLHLDPAQPRVLAKESDLRMIALNLAQNALHAMPDGGTLEVRTSRIGDRVEIAVADSGVGIATEDLERIFDPFFSRRADGSQGTGLGLPISRALARSFHGDIAVESRAGAGARFTLQLPEAAASPLLNP
jgi:signal transduction histidine kinase